MVKYKLKILFILALVITLFSSISVVVYADTSPKPQVNLVLENPPEDVLCVGLLVKKGYDEDEIKRRYYEGYTDTYQMIVSDEMHKEAFY